MSNKQPDVDPTNGRRRELTRALYEDNQVAGTRLTPQQRTDYQRELDWYKRNTGAGVAEWRAYEYERASRENELRAARLKKEADEKALSAAKTKEAEEKLRAKFEEDQDPFIQWKRSQAQRTF